MRAPARALIDRDALAADVRAASRVHALVTLAGPGGIGKTALASAISAPDGLMISLVPARSRGDVLAAIADGLGVDLDGAEAPLELLTFARERVAGVLVLDNAEHVIEVVREVCLGMVEAGAAGLVVTSRTPVGPPEFLISVPPLTAPGRRELWERVAGASDADYLDEVLAALDGNPLAIQMAASRSAVIPPSDLLSRVRQGRPMTSPDVDRPDRHRSLRELVQWSVDLLDPALRDVLFQVVRFAEPFRFADAEAVVDTEIDLVDALDQLRRSYLIREADDGLAPYELVRMALTPAQWPKDLDRRHESWLLERIQAGDRPGERAHLLASQLLADDGDDRATRMLAVAEMMQTYLRGAEGVRFFSALVKEPHLESQHRPRAIYLCARALQQTGQNRAALERTEEAEALATETIERLRLQVFRARLLCSLYARREALELAEAACAQLLELDAMRAREWRILGGARRMSGDRAGGIEAHHRGRMIGERDGDILEASNCLAEEALAQAYTDSELAFLLIDEARTIVTSRGLPVDEASLAVNRGLIAASCRPDLVRAVGEEIQAVGRDLGKPSAHVLGGAMVLCGKVLDGEAMPVAAREEIRRLLAIVPRPWIQVCLFVADVLDRVRSTGPAAGVALARVLGRRIPMAEEGMRVVEAMCLASMGELKLAEATAAGAVGSVGADAERLRSHISALIAGKTPPPPPPQPTTGPLWRALLIALEHSLSEQADRIEVGLDGSFIRSRGVTTDLSRRGPTRRVLRSLAQAPDARDSDALVEAGWPGETLIRESAQQRLWQTIRQLRKAGLGDALIREADGYRLADGVRRVAP